LFSFFSSYFTSDQGHSPSVNGRVKNKKITFELETNVSLKFDSKKPSTLYADPKRNEVKY
jgi:hypothetical protein